MRILDYDQIISEIQKWIIDYCKMAKVEGIVVGISGGIDSAVTSALSARALGKNAVIGLNNRDRIRKKRKWRHKKTLNKRDDRKVYRGQGR